MTCECGQPAVAHIDVDGKDRRFVCGDHRMIQRDDDHDIVPGCTDQAAVWLSGGCFVLTEGETALAAVIDGAADANDVPGIYRLHPDNEYYDISGIWVADARTLARLISAILKRPA